MDLKPVSATVFSVETECSLLESTILLVSVHCTAYCKTIFSRSTRLDHCYFCELGEIRVQRSEGLDFEETPKLRLVVKAETASSSSYMAVNLILQDVNDNLPRFQLQNYVAYIREAQGYDFPIIQVQ